MMSDGCDTLPTPLSISFIHKGLESAVDMVTEVQVKNVVLGRCFVFDKVEIVMRL